MESKAQARGRFRELRRKSQGPDRAAPARVLLGAPEIADAKVISSFQSYGDEPDTFALHEALKEQGKTIYLPRLNPDKTLTWLEDGQVVTPAKLKTIDVIIVPALAIDSRGVRLGQGGGSFDRALIDLSGWKVALIDHVCFTDEELPEEIHDVRMDAVATERELKRFS